MATSSRSRNRRRPAGYRTGFAGKAKAASAACFGLGLGATLRVRRRRGCLAGARRELALDLAAHREVAVARQEAGAFDGRLERGAVIASRHGHVDLALELGPAADQGGVDHAVLDV